MVEIRVDPEKCDGCGECIGVCPGEVFEIGEDGKSYPARPENCQECCSCVETCPNGAITVDVCE
ncbi:MAG TPA: ferredoxin family protein [Archaeoglobus profundus]|nr:ferredoxin family protein [Archaeoglobus profundus]